jgi:hypothetical protein
VHAQELAFRAHRCRLKVRLAGVGAEPDVYAGLARSLGGALGRFRPGQSSMTFGLIWMVSGYASFSRSSTPPAKAKRATSSAPGACPIAPGLQYGAPPLCVSDELHRTVDWFVRLEEQGFCGWTCTAAPSPRALAARARRTSLGGKDAASFAAGERSRVVCLFGYMRIPASRPI